MLRIVINVLFLLLIIVLPFTGVFFLMFLHDKELFKDLITGKRDIVSHLKGVACAKWSQ